MSLESAKRLVERATGRHRPGQDEIARLIHKRKPAVYDFPDDGVTPNNPVLPLVRYRRAVTFNRQHDPAGISGADILGARLAPSLAQWRVRLSAFSHPYAKSGSVARRESFSHSTLAMLSFCRPAPDIAGCRRAGICWWLELTRRAADMMSRGPNTPTVPGHAARSQMSDPLILTRFTARGGR